jgi:hypothetical protein
MALWEIEWLVVDVAGGRTIPAFDYLRKLDTPVRIQLLAIVDAVRSTGPDRWKDRSSHRSMHSDLSHLHEARDKHGETLYRLFLRWQRDDHRVVIIDGRTKPNSTAIADAEYEAIEKLSASIDDHPPPFAVADDFARELLKDGGDE